jgi:hypothetical protein
MSSKKNRTFGVTAVKHLVEPIQRFEICTLSISLSLSASFSFSLPNMPFPWWLLKTKKTTFGLALVVTILVAVFRKINRPPSHLRHLPYISFYTFFKAIVKDISIDRFSKDIVLPVMKRSPGAFVVRPPLL